MIPKCIVDDLEIIHIIILCGYIPITSKQNYLDPHSSRKNVIHAHNLSNPMFIKECIICLS